MVCLSWWFNLGKIFSCFCYIYKCLKFILFLFNLLKKWVSFEVVDKIWFICVNFMLFKFVLILICFMCGWIFFNLGMGILLCNCWIFKLFCVLFSYVWILFLLVIGNNFEILFVFWVVIINCNNCCFILLNFNVDRICWFIFLFIFLIFLFVEKIEI